MNWKRAAWITAATIILLVGAFFATAWIAKGVRARGPKAPDFTLLDAKGVIHHLHDYGDQKAVVLVAHGSSCPSAKTVVQSLKGLQDRFGPKGVTFLLINADASDTRMGLLKEIAAENIDVPLLMDTAQIVAKTYGFERTAEAVVITPSKGRIVYRGSVDGATNGHLRRALEAVLGGGEMPPARPSAEGCDFTYPDSKELAYGRDIAPILTKKCLNCHSRGSRFRPFLESYESVRGWSAMIRETVLTARMPPFSADPLYGKYVNDISLSAADQWKLITWIDAGLPRDPNAADPLKDYRPEQPALQRVFQGRQPIFTASMPEEAEIAPRGEVEYKYYQIAGPVPFDMWIEGFKVRSTNPRQLHHESVMITPKPLAHYEAAAAGRRNENYVRRNRDGDIPLWLLTNILANEKEFGENFNRVQVWGAGRKNPFAFGNGVALYIPKGYYLILETHYMGSGRLDTERTTIDFYGHRERRGLRQMRTLMVGSKRIAIPPRVKRYEVLTPAFPIDRDSEIIGFLAHLHMRGRAIRAIRVNADGTEDIVASIPDFYYGWQTGSGIVPDPPVRLKAGSKIRAVCEYDNSSTNPNNPDPNKEVFHGQRHDTSEMCHFNLLLADAAKK